MIQTILFLLLIVFTYLAVMTSPKAVRFFKKLYIEKIKMQEYLEDTNDKIPSWDEITKNQTNLTNRK